MLMFYIDLNGRWPQKDRFHDFAYNCIYHFFRNDLKRDVFIDINLKRDLKNYLGLCDGTRSQVEIDLARSYDGRRESINALALTLAHEIVHAKQFIRGEINDTNYIYKKGSVTLDCEGVRYSQQPWEVEAYELQQDLFDLYWT